MLKKSASGVLASFRGSTYRSVRLASSLAAALLDGLSEQPADHSASASDLRRGVISGVIIVITNKLLAWNALSEIAVIEDCSPLVQFIEQRRPSWDVQF